MPVERVVDFNDHCPPGHEEGVHLAWKQLPYSGVPDLFWTPHHGGHWVATRAALIEEMQLDHAWFSHRHVTLPPASDAAPSIPLFLRSVDLPLHDRECLPTITKASVRPHGSQRVVQAINFIAQIRGRQVAQAKTSRSIIGIEVWGSTATSSKPGPM